MAMKRLIVAILGIAFMLPPSLAHARWNDSDAKYACKQAVTNEYGARHFHGLVVDLSRFCAAPSSRLGRLPLEGDRTFPAEC